MQRTRASILVASFSSLVALSVARTAANGSDHKAPTPNAAPTGTLKDLGFTRIGGYPEALTLVSLETLDDREHPVKLRLQAFDDLADVELGAVHEVATLTIDATGLTLVLAGLKLESNDAVAANGGLGPFFFNGRAKSMRLEMRGPKA